MDSRQLVAWLAAIIMRGVAWALAAKCGMTVIESEELAGKLVSALTALVLVGVSIYTSVKGRQKLRDSQPPQAH